MSKATKHYPTSIKTPEDVEALTESLEEISKNGMFHPAEEVWKELYEKAGLNKPEGTSDDS